MTRLAHIQDAFQRFLLQRDISIESHVVGTQLVPIGTRLAIYGDGYRSRLIEALQATFPVLAELLGEADFETLAARYVDAHESSFFSIRYYGDALADFLARHADYSSAPVLAELARWEWTMAAVFDAADAEPVAVAAFAQLAPEEWAELCFEWSPSAQILALQWNVPDLWKAVTQDTARPDPELHAEAVSWLVWRRELQIYFRSVADEEAAIIAASRAGRSFGELCVMLCEHLEEQAASARAARFLRDWVQSGLIAGTHLQP
ncbi:MAG: DNA-binding domain-containing protein [Steroidobacteraceae bacterium]